MIKLGGRSLKYNKARKMYILVLLFLMSFFAGSYMMTTNNAAAALNTGVNTGAQQIAKQTKKDKKIIKLGRTVLRFYHPIGVVMMMEKQYLKY